MICLDSFIIGELQSRGLECTSTTYRTSDLGVPAARRRQCLCGFTEHQSLQLEPFGGYQVQDPPALRQLPLEVEPAENLYLKGQVTVEPTIMTTGDPWLPHPAGHICSEGTKHLVHKDTGPACALTGKADNLKGYGGTLLLVDGGRVRSLSAREVARIQGLSDPEFDLLLKDYPLDPLLLALAREPGWQVAAGLLGWVHDSLQSAEPGKAGNCIDPADLEATMQLEVWLEAWSRSPQEPKACLKLIPRKSQPERREPSNFQEEEYQPSSIRVGGRPKQLLPSLEHRKLVRPCFQTATGRKPVGLPDLDRIGQEAVLSKLADSTRRAYGTGWKHWELFMSGTGVSPFLGGESRQERLEDEQWLIRFVVFLHEVMGRTAQGIRQRLSAVRYAHIAAGFPDPLQGRVRLWASLQGLARWENAPLRKVPVTPLMLKWIFDYLLQGSRSQQEKAALWGSICIGWFFMLRASEYLPPPNPEHAPKRVLRGGDVVFYKEGQVSSFRDADEVALHLREAKNDQFQRGQTRAHHRTSAAICPVDALQAHARQNPVWISDPSAVVFQFQNVGVTREMVSDLLRLAAVAEGHPSHLVGSHSLRKGGATAMLACTDDLEQVKRFGGWKSDAVHAYLYADHATSKTRSSDMLRSKPILSSAQRTGSQPARHRPSGVKCGGHPPTLFGGYPPVASLIVGGHPPCAEAMAEARTAKAVTNHQMKELVRSGKSAYDILGVSRDTTPTDVEKAYRRKCLKWHPDKWQTHSPEEQKKVEDTFKEIGLCRDILRSTVTRAIYDDMVRNLSDSSSDEGPWVRTTTFRGTPFSGKGPQSAWTSPPPKPKPSTSSSSSSRVPPPRQPAGPPPGYGAYAAGAYGQAPPSEEMVLCRRSHLPPRGDTECAFAAER